MKTAMKQCAIILTQAQLQLNLKWYVLMLRYSVGSPQANSSLQITAEMRFSASLNIKDATSRHLLETSPLLIRQPNYIDCVTVMNFRLNCKSCLCYTLSFKSHYWDRRIKLREKVAWKEEDWSKRKTKIGEKLYEKGGKANTVEVKL